MKMHVGYQTEGCCSQEDDKTRALTAADFGIHVTTTQDGSYDQKVGENVVVPNAAAAVNPIVANTPSVNLYADSFVPSFFR